MNRRNAPHTTALRLEKLDARDNPSGNVTAVISGGQLFVAGDLADNAVSVQQNTAGDLFAFGLSGTTVNGQAVVYLGTGVLMGMDAQMGLGSDTIEVVGVGVLGNLNVQTGDGHDLIALRGAWAGNALIAGAGTGNDVVSVVGAGWLIDLDGGDHIDGLDFNGASAPVVNPRGFEYLT